VHVLATLGMLLLLNVVALVVAAVFFVDFVDQHGPVTADVPRQSAPDDGEARALAERFAPILKLDSRELFVPIRQAAYVGDTQLKEEEGRFVKTLEASPAVERLPDREGTCLRSRGCLYFLDLRGVEPAPPKHSERAYSELENHLIRTGERPTIYAHVTHYDDTGQYAVQYWFLYLFNYRLNEHESDWEQITLRLDEDKNPIDAFYSEHNGGTVRPWAAVEKEGLHPVDYPALGSHANYFGPGRHRVQIVCKRLIAGIKSCFRGRKIIVDLADGAGKTLRPSDYAIADFAGPVFIGSYGSGNYVVLTRKPDVLADPRSRGAWADPLAPLR
jgi:hypothetical protein